jgi:hypothetical protein
MKKWSVTIGVAAVAAWLIVDTVHEFFANETIQYFYTDPVRLLYVLFIAIIGGLAALGFECLSPRAKRQVRIFAWGALASTLTALVFWVAFGLASLRSSLVEVSRGVWAGVGLLLFLFSGIAAYLWFGFYRALKMGVSE